MPGEQGAQQGHRTPRARHKHSRSAAGVVASDSEGLVVQGPRPPKQHNGRRGQQQLKNDQQPAWDNNAPQTDGTFDANGNFVVSPFLNGQGGQVPGMFYMSDGTAHLQGSGHQGKKKGKSGKNPRHVNGSNTPPHANSDNEQIQQHAAMMQHRTPAKAAAAYAGPTFHASPAANSLPMPKFFSKSVPNEGDKSGLQARLEQDPEKSEDSDKTESPPATQAQTVAAPAMPIPERSNESPLDFLFKADKEQKAKRQSVTLTPPANKRDSSGPQSMQASPWQSIYGTGPRNHNRQPSNSSGREMFMMELDGREASPRPKHISPPPPLPRIPHRLPSDQYSIPELSPQAGFHDQPRPQTRSYQAQMSNPQRAYSGPQQAPIIDHSISPFNRAVPYPTPQSAQAGPQQSNAPSSQNGFHYGDRNLSTLFRAAKQEPSPTPSNLRQEVQPGPVQIGMAELPDSSLSQPIPHRQTSIGAEKAALAYLQTQKPNANVMPVLPLPRAAPQGPSELDATAPPPGGTVVTPPGVNAYNTKSIEDDLKRMLKLTSGMK